MAVAGLLCGILALLLGIVAVWRQANKPVLPWEHAEFQPPKRRSKPEPDAMAVSTWKREQHGIDTALWMRSWVDTLSEADKVYIRKQPGISEAEVDKRLLHWEAQKIKNRLG